MELTPWDKLIINNMMDTRVQMYAQGQLKARQVEQADVFLDAAYSESINEAMDEQHRRY